MTEQPDKAGTAEAPQGVPGELPQLLWYSGRYHLNIRVDAPIEGDEYFEPHAHVHDADGNQLFVINMDGSARHDSSGELDPDDAALLEALGYRIPAGFKVA